jgi:hypothetical protein
MELSVAIKVTGAVVLPLMAAGCIQDALRPGGDRCGAPDISRTVQIRNVDKVDLLFVIDNSASMADDEKKLREQVPQLARTLVTGSRGPDDAKPFAPVRDLHIAVVSGDMGASGVAGCSEQGADGVFRSSANGPSCEASYPPFQSYLAVPDASPDELANDLACIAAVGTEGCSQQQPLEAALKALWPASDSRFEFTAGPSHGDIANDGFLRSDPVAGLSLYKVIVLSDADDASPFPIARYVDGFRALRAGNERLALFSAVVSVPPDLVDAAARSGVDFSDAAQRDAYYDRILSDPRMQSTTDATTESLEGSPGRRYVEIAKAFGMDARVASLQQDDYSPVLDVVSDIVDVQLDAICLDQPLSRQESGEVACDVVWELPPERLNFDTPIECADRAAFLSSLPGTGEAGGKRCLLAQRVAGGASGEGWYYDDSSAELGDTCAPGTPQRVAFTPAAAPPTGVTVTVNCWSQAARAACE